MRALHHHATESCDDVTCAQLAAPMSLRFAAFCCADLALEFAPSPTYRIGE
ncbi:MAG TPA: hypothetical protein VNZ53_33795 [Steroidobacteraceae bacterium]|nr:hypothetical protein [Steroidobacteraceae bacterium]